MSGYYDRQGRPMSLSEWAQAFEQDDRQIAYDVIDGVRISTIWLGLDHSFTGPPPLIFETLVFEGPFDGEMDRYSTEAEALVGHAAMVERVKSAVKGDGK